MNRSFSTLAEAARSASLTTTILALSMFASSEALAADLQLIELDRAQALQPVDRFFDLTVGADFPGTLGRDDSLAQLKVPRRYSEPSSRPFPTSR